VALGPATHEWLEGGGGGVGGLLPGLFVDGGGGGVVGTVGGELGGGGLTGGEIGGLPWFRTTVSLNPVSFVPVVVVALPLPSESRTVPPDWL
jgi:hypothetical protein